MAEQKDLSSDERYRYIGFDVYGAKTGEFWKDETEKKTFIQRVKAELGHAYRNSVVYSSVLSKADRIFITFASLLMIIAPVLPWFATRTLYGPVDFTGLFGILSKGKFWFYVEKMDGWVVPVTVYLLTAIALLSLVLGVLILIATYKKAADEVAYLGRLKKVLRLNAVPFVMFILVIILGIVGQKIPFGSALGITDLSSHYSIVTLISFSSYGFWMAVFGIILNFNKAKEL